MKINKAYKYRFFPTNEQKNNLAQTFGCARFVYNQILDVKTKSWNQEKKSLSYHETSKLLTELKKQQDKKFLNEVSSVCLQQSLRSLDTAFRNFFKGTSKYPNFKKAKSQQSARYVDKGFTFTKGKLKLAKHKQPLEISWSRPLPNDAKINSVTVSKDTIDRYFISIQFETDWQPLENLETSVGIDVGITTLATLSNGEKLDNPKFFHKAEKKIKRLQKRLSRKKKGSNNRKKAKLKLAKAHAKVVDKRTDYIHKFTTKLIRENQSIFVEGLSIVNMLKNHNLAKAIQNASWGEMFRQLQYKAEWYGRTYKELDRFFPSSKLCSNCGHLLVKLPLSIREWSCSKCEVLHDRDVNAAKNIEIAGLFLLSRESGASEVTPKSYES